MRARGVARADSGVGHWDITVTAGLSNIDDVRVKLVQSQGRLSKAQIN